MKRIGKRMLAVLIVAAMGLAGVVPAAMAQEITEDSNAYVSIIGGELKFLPITSDIAGAKISRMDLHFGTIRMPSLGTEEFQALKMLVDQSDYEYPADLVYQVAVSDGRGPDDSDPWWLYAELDKFVPQGGSGGASFDAIIKFKSGVSITPREGGQGANTEHVLSNDTEITLLTDKAQVHFGNLKKNTADDEITFPMGTYHYSWRGDSILLVIPRSSGGTVGLESLRIDENYVADIVWTLEVSATGPNP